MTKSDLKNNMICKTRDGEYKLVVDLGKNNFGWVGIINNTTWCSFNGLSNDDLTWDWCDGDNSLDIMEVYKPDSIYAVGRIMDSSCDNCEKTLNSYYTKIYDRKKEKSIKFIALLEDKNADLKTIVELLNEWEKLTPTEKAECIDMIKGE